MEEAALSPPPLLHARGLHLRHVRAKADAVRDLHLDIREGEILAILGPNGSGKSTALAGLARGLEPRQGTVEVGGRPAGSLSRKAFAREVAFLPQHPSCPEGLTVEDLVAGGRHPHLGFLQPPRPEDRAAVAEALSWLDLTDLRQRAVATLSGGERRRAWLAMALCQGARLLLLDEPTAGLDLRHQWELLELLARINRERGITIGVVLHDAEQAASLAHRLAVFCRGRLYAAGRPEECLTPEVFLDVFGVATEIRREGESWRVRVLGPGLALRNL